MAGIQVYNSNNTLLLNESYINLVLSRKIQISSVGELDIVFTGEECIGAIGGDNGTIDAYCENSETKCHIIVNSLPSGGLIAYIFSKDSTPTKNGVGLQIYNKNNKLVYDSSRYYGKVIKTLADSNRDVSSTKKVAIACGLPSLTYHTNAYQFERDSITTITVAHTDKYPVEYEYLGLPTTWIYGSYTVVKSYINYMINNGVITKKVRKSDVVDGGTDHIGMRYGTVMDKYGKWHTMDGFDATGSFQETWYYNGSGNYYETTLDITTFIVFDVTNM